VQENGAIVVTDIRYRSNPLLARQIGQMVERTGYPVLANKHLEHALVNAYNEGYEHVIVFAEAAAIDKEEHFARRFDEAFESIQFVEESTPRFHIREQDAPVAPAAPAQAPKPAGGVTSLTLIAINANPPLKGFKANVVDQFKSLKLTPGTKLLKVLMPPAAGTLGADFRFSLLPSFYPEDAAAKAFDATDWFPLGNDAPVGTTIQKLLADLKVAAPAAFPVIVGGTQAAAGALTAALAQSGLALQALPPLSFQDGIDTTIGTTALKICDTANITDKKPEEVEKLRAQYVKGKTIQITAGQKTAAKLLLGYWAYANKLIDLNANPRSGKNSDYFKNLLSAEDKAIVDEIAAGTGVKDIVDVGKSLGRLVGINPDKKPGGEAKLGANAKTPGADSIISPDKEGKNKFDLTIMVSMPEFAQVFQKLDLA